MPRQIALRWGYAITACGFLFLFGPVPKPGLCSYH
jgi:hypothetical protein